MHSICKLIFAFTVAVLANGAAIGPVLDAVNEPVTEIYDFWKEQEKSFHLGDQKEVVLFLGNTGSGKSTTALFVTGANLNAAVPAKKKPIEPVAGDSGESFDYEVPGDDGDEGGDDAKNADPSPSPVTPVISQNILITDDRNKIGNETLTSHTLIPDLFTDELDVAYYDCPGFEDTRKPKFELTIAFFLQKLMTYADSFKLVFVAPYWSVRTGSDRSHFEKMVHNALTLIKNTGNYSNAIGLVVTKVESPLTDEKVIEDVIQFLEEAKQTIGNKNDDANLPAEERKTNSDSVEFIDKLVIMRKTKNQKTGEIYQMYPRIAIFRKAEQEGSLYEIPIFAKEQLDLKTMIKRLKYFRKENNDFGFVISDKSRDYVEDLTQMILEDGFGSDMVNIRREVKEFYHKNENLTLDVSELYQKLKKGAELFAEVKAEDPRLFMKKILNATYELDMAISNNVTEPILKHIESIDFLLTVVPQTLTNYKLIHEASLIKNYLTNSENWYHFLMFLEDELTNIGFQDETMKTVARTIVGNLKRFGNAGSDASIAIGEIKIELNPILEKFVNKEIPYLDSITSIDTSNLKALKNVLNEYTSDTLDISDCTSNPHDMEVKGHVIKMSDVTDNKCFSAAKNIKIFALKKLIVDKSVNKTGEQAQMVIIAPTWDIIGPISFILDGVNGLNHSSAYALNGTGSQFHPDNGKKGEPGSPGSAGGNFFAIGSKFLHGDYLTIQVNGGNGGDGQHGGNGMLMTFLNLNHEIKTD